MPIRNRFAELQPEIAGWRQHIHAHPELLFETAETAQFEREMRKAVRTINRTSRKMEKDAARMKSAFKGVGAAIVAAFSVRAVAQFTRDSVKLAAQTERSFKRMEAVIRATGGAAGVTAKEVNAFASEMQRTTEFSADQINDAAAALLTFKTIGRESFTRTLRAATDLSFVLQQDLKSSILQLGKALEDPTRGLTALRRSGVSFTEDQKAVIKSLQDTNRLAEAQAEILKAVEGQVSGASATALSTYAGATVRLGNAWEEVRKALVAGWTGGSAPTFLNMLADSLDNLAEAMNARTADPGGFRSLGGYRDAASALETTRREIARIKAEGVGFDNALQLTKLREESWELVRALRAAEGSDYVADMAADWRGIAADIEAEQERVARTAEIMARTTIGVGPNASDASDEFNKRAYELANAEATAERNAAAILAPVREARGRAELAAAVELAKVRGREVGRAEFEARAEAARQLQASQGMGEEQALFLAAAKEAQVKEQLRSFDATSQAMKDLEDTGFQTAFNIGNTFAQQFAQATMAGESFGDAMSQMLESLAQQALASGIAGLIGAGVGFAFNGAAGARAGFQLGSGITFHSGGMVDGGSTMTPRLASDEVPIIAQRGELVVPKEEAQDMMGGGGGGGRPVVLQIDGRQFGRLIGDLTRSGRVAVG